MKSTDPDMPIDLPGEYGIEFNYLPDDQAPPVDNALLERLAKNELPPEESELVFRLVNMFRSWRQAFTEIVKTNLASVANQEWDKLVGTEAPWFSTELSWPNGQVASAVVLVLALAICVSKRLRLSIPGNTRSDPTTDPKITSQHLENALAGGSPLDFRDQERWLHWAPTSEGVDIRAGSSPADAFPDFTLEFLEKGTTIAKHQSHAGVVRLTLNDSLALIQGKADELRITASS